MAKYITVDGGTTNTRLSLVIDGSVVETRKYNVGARASIDGKAPLINALREGISELLKARALSEADVERIIASGMITCEHGLLELPHLMAPAGIAELHDEMVRASFPEITSIPFAFIRGVRCGGDPLDTDMMRGEETELMGIIGENPAGVYLLPGSHAKVVRVDELGRITDFVTTLTGEMIHAISTETILKSSLKLDSALCREALISGFEAKKALGLNAALFKVRTLKNLFGKSDSEVYSFFLGAVLSDEIAAVGLMNPARVVIGGKRQLREAEAILLGACMKCEVVCLSDDEVDISTAMGAVKIYEYND